MVTGGTASDVSIQDAFDAVQRHPREAIAIAQRVLAAARAAGDVDGESVAERAIGLALRELTDFPAALRHLRRAVRRADRPGSEHLAALAQMSLGYVLASTGRNTAALRAVNAALAELTGADAARARMQRGVVLHFCGRYGEAARDYTAAIELAGREGDLVLEARARNNRGLLHAHLGTAGNPDEDFERAVSIFSGLGHDLAALDVRWNTGIAAAQRGQVPRALRVFAEVETGYRRLDVPRPALLLDRLELLLSIPLLEEAGALADAAFRELHGRGMASDLAEVMLAQSRVALLSGDLDAAVTVAAQARRRLRRQGRHTWAAFARHVELRAQFRRGVRTTALLTAMVGTADRLDAVGWQAPALVARIEAARVAIDLRRHQRARELLVVASRRRRRGTAGQRAQGWYAVALRRRLDGDEPGASAALRRGLTELEVHRASLGAAELRASSGTYGHELAREGLDIAVGTGRAAQVLRWAEYSRAGALRMTPVLPPRDPELAAALTELRAVSSALEEAMLGGEPAPGLRGRQAHLEQQVRELARRVEGNRHVTAPPGVPALAARLGHRVLVELAVVRGRILAVVIRDGRATLHDLCPADGVLRQARLLLFGLRRAITLTDPAAGRGSAARAAAQLDEQLFGPLRRRVDDRPLVVVPPGQLNALAWSALPSCAGRPVSAAPSAAAWLRATAQGVPDGAAVLVAGPRLPAAADEVRKLATELPHPRVLVGAEARVDAVTAALDGASVAHIAAHGTFRADNPLFSTIELTDGPLIAYELERLRRAPGCVVLPACDSGLSGIRPGDELIGFTAALLGLGTRTLVATVLPVPAEATTALMLDLHRRMYAGAGPAEALAAAQYAYTRGGDDLAYATAAAFVCLGSG